MTHRPIPRLPHRPGRLGTTTPCEGRVEPAASLPPGRQLQALFGGEGGFDAVEEATAKHEAAKAAVEKLVSEWEAAQGAVEATAAG